MTLPRRYTSATSGVSISYRYHSGVLERRGLRVLVARPQPGVGVGEDVQALA